MGLRILVVDDSADMRESLLMVLHHLGHEALEAASGTEALAGIEQWQPDVVLVDLGMPGMSGYDVALRARQGPRGAALRLVALTGSGSDDARERVRAAGFDAHALKPLDLEGLRSLLEHASQVKPAAPPDGESARAPGPVSQDGPSPLDHLDEE